MLIPNFFEIEERTIEIFLEKSQAASMGDSCRGELEIRMTGNNEPRPGYVGVAMEHRSLLLFRRTSPREMKQCCWEGDMPGVEEDRTVQRPHL